MKEANTKYHFITPAIEAAGWKKTQIHHEYPVYPGRIKVQGAIAARGKPLSADYVLLIDGQTPIAVIEAKELKKSDHAGMQQALNYAKFLDVPFAFSSSGTGFVFHDKTSKSETEVKLGLNEFPSPEELISKYLAWRGIASDKQELIRSPNYQDPGGRKPRYYQQIAMDRVMEAVTKGQDRILLTMATGCGKTYTAFQIVWRLWKETGRCKRVLFVADRNILVGQTMQQDFAPFGDKMTKVSRGLLDDNNQTDTSFEIYLGLYQSLIGKEGVEDLYDKFSPEFFDLVVIDECHRGSAEDDSQWKVILKHFRSAIHLGLTATPKETKHASNTTYFGEPVFSYSLKQGIMDGFLAPFKVIRIDIDKDLDGWTPSPGQRDDYGHLIEQREYNRKDYDRNLVLDKRTRRVANRITDFMHATDPKQKAIVFCEDIEHADRMRFHLANCKKNVPLMRENDRYVVKITGDDKVGKAELYNFIHPRKTHPVIATTSQLMSTGVDAKTCKLIVLDKQINSMTMFKQIVGRGTRLLEEEGKLYFTIIDFRGVTRLFQDDEWDGPALVVYEAGSDGPMTPTESESDEVATPEDEEENNDPRKFYVSDVEVKIVKERVQYLNSKGELVLESIKDFTKSTIQKEFRSLDNFLRRWTEEERKGAVIEALVDQDVLIEALQEEVGHEYGAFDLICHIAFDQPPLTRKERADGVRKRNVFGKYGDTARKVLVALLDKYADQGIRDIEDAQILQLNPFTELGTPVQIIKAFGGKSAYLKAIRDLQKELYSSQAS